jgi:glycosyltransferase involved in cell wall biosynthesis
VILFSPLLRAILPIRLACTVAHVPLAHERSEFPFVSEDKPTLGGRLWRFLYLAAVFRLFDGQIVISTLLEDFVRERARRGSWILRVPILVDADAFSCSGPPTAGLVGYAGNLSHSEELFQFVGAVSVVATAHGDVRACIMGGGSPAETAALERETARLGVADRIELAGRFAHDDMPARLCSCAVLALPRTQGLFSSAGFPTKLGEYLATGRPVVVTATGDIPMYLRPGVDAFVVPPDDSEAFSAALERALYEPASVAIGDAGRDVARTRFDPATHMGRVLDALETSWAG